MDFYQFSVLKVGLIFVLWSQVCTSAMYPNQGYHIHTETPNNQAPTNRNLHHHIEAGTPNNQAPTNRNLHHIEAGTPHIHDTTTGFWVQAKNGDVPHGAVPGGDEQLGSSLYICRVNHGGYLIIGKLVPFYKTCWTWNSAGKLNYNANYEVLVNIDRLVYNWIPANYGEVKTGAVVGGSEPDASVTFICRAKHHAKERGIIIVTNGKLKPGQGACFIAYHGEHRYTQYEILVQVRDTVTRKFEKAVCVIKDPIGIEGNIWFKQYESGPVYISGKVKNLTPGPHGFHVHQFGDNSVGCVSTGPHFNPEGKTHGGPHDHERHIGDLGTVYAGTNGVAVVNLTDHFISLSGIRSIIGRAIVVHASDDDFGKGGHVHSLTSGNAGDRLGCCAIGYADSSKP